MLSNIQVFLEKNRHWLFGFLLVVIVVPFVFTIGNMPGLVGGKKRHLKLLGEDLSDPKRMQEIVAKGSVSLVLQDGMSEEQAWAESAKGYAFARLWWLHLAHTLRLPEPDAAALQAFIKTQQKFIQKGEFQAALYNQYLRDWSYPFSLRSVMVENYQCAKVRHALEYTGGYLPQECEAVFKNIKTTYDLDYFTVKNEEKAPEQLHNDDVRKYFEDHKEDYRIPQQATVTLLFFDKKPYHALLPKPSEADLKAYFDKHKDQFKLSEKAETAAASGATGKHEQSAAAKVGKADSTTQANAPLDDWKQVQEQVQAAWADEQAMRLASEAASQFAEQVYEKNIHMHQPEWKALVKQYHVRCVYSVPPYTFGSASDQAGLSATVLRKAFELKPEHFLSDPEVANDGAALIALNQFLPPHIPDLDKIRSNVLADAKQAKRKAAFDKKVTDLQTFLAKNGDLTKKGFEVKALKNISSERLDFENLSKVLSFYELFNFRNTVASLTLNQWSKPYQSVDDGVVFFRCRAKHYPQAFETQEDFKTFQKNFASHQALIQSSLLTNEALEKAFVQ